jgi:hypothetical protein
MIRTVTIQPINSIVFVSGGDNYEVPAESFDPKRSLVAASSTCLIVGVLPEVDGPTELTIGPAREIDPGYSPSFVGPLETDSRRIIIDQVDGYIIHDQPVTSVSVIITIWLSHPRWPEKVFIGID